MKCFNRTKNIQVAASVEKADTAIRRMVGLLSRSGLGPEEGLLLSPCPQVHTFFMRFVMDAVFLDRGGKVLLVIGSMKPWRMSPWVSGSHSVLELAGGAAAGKISEGDVLSFE